MVFVFQLTGLSGFERLQPNNSFKPNLLRYTNNMAGRACHVVGSATQVGLTQALGLGCLVAGDGASGFGRGIAMGSGVRHRIGQGAGKAPGR